jgi:uncharacterized protein (TIGR02145 family)
VLFVCVLGLATGVVTGCRDNPIAPANIDNRTVYVNPDDAMLYSFSLDSGEHYTYYGHRDAAGLATVITLLDYIDAEGETYTIMYDDMGLPSMVNNEAGATLVFDYTLTEAPEAQGTGSSVRQSAGDGLMQIDAIGVTIQTVSDGVSSEVRTVITPDEPVVVYRNHNSAEMRAAEPVGTVAVTIDKCGEAADPPAGSVKVGVRRLAHHAPRYYPAYPTGRKGRFVSNVPYRSPETLPENTEAVCASFADALSSFCSVFGPLAKSVSLDNPAVQALFCLKVTAAVSLAALPAGATAGKLCSVLLPAGTAACETMGWSPTGAPQNLMQKLCGSLGDALKSIDAGSGLDTVLLQASVDFSAGSPVPLLGDPDDKPWVFTSQELAASAYAQYPDLDIGVSEPAIDQCATAPGAPKAGHGYVVSARLSCVAGMDISLSVTRDGAPLAQTTARGDADTQTVSLNVPGEPAGAVDGVRVTVSDPATGSPVARKEIAVTLTEDDENDPSGFATVTIGNQVWMQSNLNIASGNSWCHSDSDANCETYGRLYDWQTASTLCPPGWHLPTDDEWQQLVDYLGGREVAGGKMKATGTVENGTGLWKSPNTNATNESGFSALPSGDCYDGGMFGGLGFYTTWWSATEAVGVCDDVDCVWTRALGYNYGYIGRSIADMHAPIGMPVRCIKNAE